MGEVENLRPQGTVYKPQEHLCRVFRRAVHPPPAACERGGAYPPQYPLHHLQRTARRPRPNTASPCSYRPYPVDHLSVQWDPTAAVQRARIGRLGSHIEIVRRHTTLEHPQGFLSARPQSIPEPLPQIA